MKNIVHTAIVTLIKYLRPVHAIDPERIACIELSRMGDVLAMLPALRLLRTNFPSSEIIIVVQQSYAELFRRIRVADEVIGIEKRRIIHTIDALRKRDVTLTCSMSPATTNALCALFGAKSSIGYLGPPRTLPGILDKSVVSGIGAEVIRQEYFKENIYQRGVKICRALRIPVEPLQAIITTNVDWENSSLDVLRSLDLAIRSAYIILHPLAGWKYRSWPGDQWNRLIEKIVRNTLFECVLISSSTERKQLEQIAQKTPRVHYASGLPMEHLAVLIKRSAGFVGNDSGPLHMAAALGTPVIGLFGPAAPVFTAPLNGNGFYFYQQLECSPCNQRRCIRPHDSCMMQLNPDSIFETIEKLFGKTSVQAGEHNT
ncbi:MAG: glycosyltransferase family 9 protein [Bacteroidota bacterium]